MRQRVSNVSFRDWRDECIHNGRRWTALCAMVGALAAGPASAAGTFYVDTNNPNASDLGPGTAAQPYKTISAAARIRGGPATTINVKTGIYYEQVTIDTSGTQAQPYVIQGLGPAVILDGADDFTNPALWSVGPGSSWLAASVNWSPKQVFADGARLGITDADPSVMPLRTFRYVDSTGLYVNVGGNPASHDARVGHRSHGFRVPARDDVTIQGFRVRRTEDHGIYLVSGSSRVTVRGDTVSFCAAHGIAVSGGAGILIERNAVSDNHDHGINFLVGVTSSVIQDNESFHNTRIFQRAANGIALFGSSNNVIQRNRLHDNEDTGLDLTNGANNNLSIQNVSWNNGDHGFDHIIAAGTRHINDVAYGNHNDGVSFEGNSSGGVLVNCISANNGRTTGRFDVFVDSSSTTGFESSYDIIWNSNVSQKPIKYNGVVYATVYDFSQATGHDAHSSQSDPRFVNPGAGDFHLQSGSKAIDSANSGVANWPLKDLAGTSRIDDPVSPNTGIGPVPYADRGAYEFARTGPVSVEDLGAPRVWLGPAAPNPGRGPVTFALDLARAGRVRWQVTDVMGRVISDNAELLTAGRATLRWTGLSARGKRAPAGMYQIRVEANGETLTRSFAVIH